MWEKQGTVGGSNTVTVFYKPRLFGDKVFKKVKLSSVWSNDEIF